MLSFCTHNIRHWGRIPEHLENEEMGSGGGRVGVLCPNIATVGFYWVYLLPFGKTKFFLRNFLKEQNSAGSV